VTARGAAVAVEHVSKTYGGRVAALRDASLRLAPGDFAALTGPSGSGKSTLLNLIGSLDRPDGGTIEVAGQSIADLRRPDRFRRDVLGFVFQFHHLLPMLTARENVEVPLIAAGVRASERAVRTGELLAEVGLEGRATHLPSQLSGGERQRVAVARALANRPRLLLADEPTGALDSAASDRVLDLLARLREAYGMTLLVVSYDPAIGERAERVLRMQDGRVVDG
jgi:ABC-type lipoprotein export system ATPase subunit